MDCPFCGDEGHVEEVGIGSYPIHAVICRGCGTVGPAREQPLDAVAAWDSRPPFAGLPTIPGAIRRDRTERPG